MTTGLGAQRQRVQRPGASSVEVPPDLPRIKLITERYSAGARIFKIDLLIGESGAPWGRIYNFRRRFRGRFATDLLPWLVEPQT